jgi:predicted Zn-dependent peptidase
MDRLHGRSMIGPAILMVLLLGTAAAAAEPWDRFAPRGLFDFEEVRLENGLRIVLKQRPDTRNVAFRLVVGLGTRQFACGKRETPHLLEHLLFSGTTRHSEAEMESLVQDLGGSWNATTGTERTTYQLDIFDRYALEGLGVLYEIVTDSVLTPEKISRAKSVVYREEGGNPGTLRRWLYRLNIGKGAWDKANAMLLPGDGAVCPGLVNMEQISEADLKEALRTAYVPENMMLVAVGNIDRRTLLDRIAATFGSMPRASKPFLHVTTPVGSASGPAVVSSSLSPFFGSSGSLSMAFRTEGRDHPDAAPLIVLSTYLNEKFYDEIRVKAGLSYAPEAVMFFQPDYGIFYATADIGSGELGQVRDRMIAVLDRLQSEKVSPAEVKRTKRKILLQWAQAYQTNAGLASFYADRLSRDRGHGLRRNGADPDILLHYDREVSAVSAADIDRVITRYLGPGHRVEVRSFPTMSYAFFFTLCGGVLLAIAAAAAHRMLRAAKKTGGPSR